MTTNPNKPSLSNLFILPYKKYPKNTCPVIFDKLLNATKEEFIAYLEEHPEEINARVKNDYTPIIVAGVNVVRWNLKDQYQILFDFGADLNIKTRQDENLLMLLCQSEDDVDFEINQLIASQKIDINLTDQDYQSALFHAIDNYLNNTSDGAKICFNRIKMLIEAGANINFQCDDPEHEPVLILAISNHISDLSLIKLLLESGADANIKNAYNETPLYFAVINNNSEAIVLVKLLLEYGADPHIKYGTSSNKSLIVLLLKDYNRYNNDICTLVKFLLDVGLDVNEISDFNFDGHEYTQISLLMMACLVDVNVVNVDVNDNENINVNKGGDLIKLFLEYGADVNYQSPEYGTAFDLATRYKLQLAISLLT